MNSATCSIGIMGLGLIGGSIAKALREAGAGRRITAVDCRRETLDYALRHGIIDEGSASPEMLFPSDLIILAVPIGEIIQWLRTHGPSLPEGTVIMDTGSTKRQIMEEMQKLPPGIHPIGGHPMAGKETSGISAAEGSLFRGSAFFLTPLPATPAALLGEIQSFVRLLGAHPVVTDAARHDSMVAASSHLPYLAAAALSLSIEESLEHEHAGRFFSSGFRDTSRLAAQDIEMTLAICTSNRDMLAARLRGFLREAEALLALLEHEDDQSLKSSLAHARAVRMALYPPS